MGLYSNNRTSLSDVEIPALEGYNGNVGIATAMLEAAQDDLKFFDMIIARDFQEAEMNAAGYTNESEEMDVLTEGVLGNAWKKIVEFLKKLLAKIKAIFSSVITKINTVLIRDNKKLVEKYGKAVTGKDLKDMKYKWADAKADCISVEKATALKDKLLAEINKGSLESVEKFSDNHENLVDEFYTEVLGENVESNEFAKKAHEFLWNDTEELDEGANSKKGNVIVFLKGSSKKLDGLVKDQRALETSIKKDISEYEGKSKKALDKASNDPANGILKLNLAKANTCQKVLTAYQTAILAIHRENVNGLKFETSQNRAFFTKAAAYSAKNESVELFDAIEEAVAFDVDTTFADYAVAE